MAIIDAIKDGNLNKFRQAIENKENVNEHFGEDEDTPLHIAVDENNLQMVQELLNAGAKPNALNMEEMTPLLLAMEMVNPNLKIIQELVSKGANLEAKNRDGYNPLHTATELGHSFEIVEFLVKAGADLEAIGGEDNYKTPLHSLVTKLENEKVDPRIMKMLIVKGANVEAFTLLPSDDPSNKIIDPDANLPIDLAIQNNVNKEAIQILINNMPNINIRNGSLDTPLHKAANICARYDYIKMLLDNGADVSLVNEERRTPLHSLAYSEKDFSTNEEKYKNILLLINRGADIHARDSDGYTALDVIREEMGESYANEIEKNHNDKLESIQNLKSILRKDEVNESRILESGTLRNLAFTAVLENHFGEARQQQQPVNAYGLLNAPNDSDEDNDEVIEDSKLPAIDKNVEEDEQKQQPVNIYELLNAPIDSDEDNDEVLEDSKLPAIDKNVKEDEQKHQPLNEYELLNEPIDSNLENDEIIEDSKLPAKKDINKKDNSNLPTKKVDVKKGEKFAKLAAKPVNTNDQKNNNQKKAYSDDEMKNPSKKKQRKI